MSDAQKAVTDYVRRCSQLARSGAATDETSYYPPINELIGRLGSLRRPTIIPVSNPAAREGDLPDVACLEESSQVLVLPFEVKPASRSVTQLLKLAQGKRYAQSFGGGHVMLTNLWQFVWAELDERGELEERSRVALVSDAAELGRARPKVLPDAGRELAAMLDSGWTVRPAMDDPRQVARLLGWHGRALASRLEQAGGPKAMLRTLTTSFQEGLNMDLDEEFLVGTVVQTLVYGLFAAWLEVEEPETFKWQEAAHQIGMNAIAGLLHDVSNPPVVRHYELGPRLAAIARVLNWVDRDAFERHFDYASVEYFYEPFLAEFDPELRTKLGVWYTPREIAEYQVRRTHHHLREQLEIEDGLADPGVLILDPACGTGTYLAAVLRHIHQHHLDEGASEATATRRTVEAAHTRVIGFEVLPAAFIVANINLHRLLVEMGARDVDEGRLRVYLTNALTGWGSGPVPQVPLPGLEEELRESRAVKDEESVIAIIGNPPYEGYSAAESREEQELAKEWIDPLFSVWGVRKHRLGDLYVRFWRIATLKIAEREGRGIVSFITNRKWLAGRSAPVMRESIVGAFADVIVDDLHGDMRGKAPSADGSVFSSATAKGITVGVAIVTAIRPSGHPDEAIATVKVRDLHGSGAEKREALAASDPSDEGVYRTQSVSAATRWRLTGESGLDAPALNEYLPRFLSGIQPVRDEAVTDTDRASLEGRMRDYFSDELGWEELAKRHPAFDVSRSDYDARQVHERLRTKNFEPSRLQRYLYRPFTERWLYWELDHKLLHRARRDLSPYHSIPGQVYLVAAQAPRRAGSHPLVTSAIPAFAAVDPDARVFPKLVTAAREDGQLDLEPSPEHGVLSGVAPEWIVAARLAGAEGDDVDVGDVVFFSLLAVAYAPSWAMSIPPDQDDFAPVPLPADLALLERAATLGRRIAELSDLGESVQGIDRGVTSAMRHVGRIHLEQDSKPIVTVGSSRQGSGGEWLSASDAVRCGAGFEIRGVTEAVWNLTLGGFQVLSKWLSYRVGTSLTSHDQDLVESICRRLAALAELQDECDEIHAAAIDDMLEPLRR